MEKQELTKILQTILLLKDDVSEFDIMVTYGLGKYLNKAKKVKNYIENEL